MTKETHLEHFQVCPLKNFVLFYIANKKVELPWRRAVHVFKVLVTAC